MYTSSLKRETRWFHVVVVQQRQRNEQKCVMFVQSCCFVLLCRSPCPPRRRCISSLKDERAAPFLFSRRIALGTRMDLLYGLRSTRVVTRLLLLDMQCALYLWPNSSYTQDMEKGSVLEPGFCLGLCCWEIHTLILLNIKKGPETGRQPSFFNPVSMGYHWNKTGSFAKNLFREERTNTCQRERNKRYLWPCVNTMRASYYPTRNTPENVSYHIFLLI